MRITRDMPISEFELHRYSIFASDIGLKPGEWPTRFDTDLGNGQPLLIMKHSGDYVIYRQMLGCIFVHVLND